MLTTSNELYKALSTKAPVVRPVCTLQRRSVGPTSVDGRRDGVPPRIRRAGYCRAFTAEINPRPIMASFRHGHQHTQTQAHTYFDCRPSVCPTHSPTHSAMSRRSVVLLRSLVAERNQRHEPRDGRTTGSLRYRNPAV